MDGGRTAVGQTTPALSLVVPAYNEEAGIGRAIREADEALATLGWSYEILVVDDGSSDRTAEIVEEESQKRPAVRMLKHPHNQGYGAALRTGFQAARFEHVAFTDADCQFYLDDLASLTQLAEQYPIAVGYRIDRQDPWLRRFYSKGYNLLVRALLGTRVRDCDCALKVFRKSVLANILPETRGFFVNAEMLTRARQLRYAVAETGVRHRPRLEGTSKVSLWDVPRVLRTLIPFWWSRVLFPATELPAHAASQASRSRRPRLNFGLYGIFAIAAVLFLSRLQSPLLEPDEARYAEIPRQMLAEGRVVLPVLHGQPYHHKPPLHYWLVMLSYTCFGVHDWAARLVPCAASILVVFVTYLWGRRVAGAGAAFAGALMLCLSARFVYFGRMLTLDSLLCLWVVAGWAAGHLALFREKRASIWWALSALACGLGLMTKGPVALVLIAMPLLALQVLDPRVPRATLKSWAAFVGISVGVAFPWYALVAAQDPSFLREFFWTHNVQRFTTPLDHQEPCWFYLPGLLLGMLPWTLLLPPLLRFLTRRSATSATRRPAALGYFCLTALWCLAFFSAAGCKRPAYILPVMPPLALALGCYLTAALPRRALEVAYIMRSIRPSYLPHRATILILALGIAGSIGAMFAGLQKSAHGVVLVPIAIVGLLYLLRNGPARRVLTAWGVLGVATFAVLLIGLQDVLPGYARKFSLKAQVRPQRDLSMNPAVPVVCYPHRWDSVSFYLERNDVRAYAPADRAALIADLRAQPNTIVFVKSDKSLKDLLRDLPSSLEFISQSKLGFVTAGIVCRRSEFPAMMYARR